MDTLFFTLSACFNIEIKCNFFEIPIEIVFKYEI